MNIDTLEREQIVEQIQQGCDEGFLNSGEDEIHWILNIDKFKR